MASSAEARVNVPRAQLTTLMVAKVGKRLKKSGRGRKAFLERTTLIALFEGQTVSASIVSLSK